MANFTKTHKVTVDLDGGNIGGSNPPEGWTKVENKSQYYSYIADGTNVNTIKNIWTGQYCPQKDHSKFSE